MNNAYSPRSTGTNRRESGFTLIELLVSSTLMAVLVGMVLYISSGVLRSWNDASDRLHAHAEARFALDTMVSDLESAVFRTDGGTWMIAEKEAVPGIGEGVWLRLFAPVTDRDRGTVEVPISGDLNAIGYFLRYANPINSDNPDGRVAGIYRVVVDGERTLRDIQGNLDGMTKEDFLQEGEFEGADSDARAASSFLAGNVVSFKIRFFVRSDDSAQGDSAIRPLDGDRIEFSRRSGIPGPSYADISLVVIRDEGARILRAIDSGELSSTDRSDVIGQFGTLFSRRVTFLNRPL